jgi:hypothetical protein
MVTNKADGTRYRPQICDQIDRHLGFNCAHAAVMRALNFLPRSAAPAPAVVSARAMRCCQQSTKRAATRLRRRTNRQRVGMGACSAACHLQTQAILVLNCRRRFETPGLMGELIVWALFPDRLYVCLQSMIPPHPSVCMYVDLCIGISEWTLTAQGLPA